MTTKELKEFTFENYHRQTGFTKDNHYSMKNQKEKGLLLLAAKLIKSI